MMIHEHDLWNGAYKIPWNDPDFSRRMLAEHLTQAHDLASRRLEWVERQVAWIHSHIFGEGPSAILDLGCGPGLYSHRLAQRGHQCVGLDFGPASITHAQQHNPDPARCRFELADIRTADFSAFGRFDLVMLLYGEFNVFSPTEAHDIVRKARRCLAPGGRLIIEAQSPDAIARSGAADPSEQQNPRGLFSDGPHTCHTESQWLADERVAVQTFTITEANGNSRTYRSTTQAWPEDRLRDLLIDAGFNEAARCDDWPCNTDALALWQAQ